MIQTSARLLSMLALLQQRRSWTGTELADELEVTPRTVRRDVDKLRELGYPIEAEQGVAGGYRLGAGGTTMPPLLLDDAEAVAVAVGLRSAASGSISGVEDTSMRALTKLEQILPTRLRKRVRELGAVAEAFPSDGPRVDADVLATVAGACRDRTQLRFAYAAANGDASRRHVEPCAVVHAGRRWYLVAFDLDRDDWRTLRIDRITSKVKVGDARPKREIPGGDAAAFVEARLEGRAVESQAPPGRIWVGAPIAQVRPNVPRAYSTVEPDGDDACIVTSVGSWSRQFLVWVLLLDLPCEVLGPPELVDRALRLGEQLRNADRR